MSASYDLRRSPAVFCWRENLRHLGYLFVPLAAAALRISDSGCCSSETGRHKGRKRRVHDANCMGCHDTGIYTRKDRLVQSWMRCRRVIWHTEKSTREK